MFNGTISIQANAFDKKFAADSNRTDLHFKGLNDDQKYGATNHIVCANKLVNGEKKEFFRGLHDERVCSVGKCSKESPKRPFKRV